VGRQNGQKNCWTEILAETLAPLLLGVDRFEIFIRENKKATKMF
jgi:hypothetical protein